MKTSVGPFSTAPRTSGETATTGAGGRAQRVGDARRPRGSARSRSPGSRARSRPRAPSAIASSASGVGVAAPAPSISTPSTGPAARSRIMNSWKPNHSPRARTRVRTGSSVGGSTRAAHAERRPQLRERLGQPRALGQPPRALQADGEVAVAEVEPDVLAELAQRVHDREGVVAQAPAALVDAVGEPVEDEVGIGRDVAAVDLDVVAGVGDHDELARRPRRACPRASLAPPVPPASRTTGELTAASV